jgi:FkbM family methyltransferase
MKDIFIGTGSPLRSLFPLVRKSRQWAWKYHDRTAKRLVISGGKIKFMDTELEFPEKVGLLYSTHLFWNGPDAYEGPTSRTIALLACRSKLFLDIGSNIGIYAVYVGVKFPQVKRFVFEPVPAIWEKNCALHRANGLADREVMNLALSDDVGPRKIFIPVYDTALEEEQTATLNSNSWQFYEKKVEALEIKCTTLDTFAAENELPGGPCCLKIDVENCEAAVLRGGKKFIASRRPSIVCEILPCEEFDPATRTKRNNNKETLALAQELDYATFAITADGYFRMNTADFSRSRSLKDFVLMPREKIANDICFLASEDLSEIGSA